MGKPKNNTKIQNYKLLSRLYGTLIGMESEKKKLDKHIRKLKAVKKQ